MTTSDDFADGWYYVCLAFFVKHPETKEHAAEHLQQAFEGNAPPAGFFTVDHIEGRMVLFTHRRPDHETDYCSTVHESGHHPDDDQAAINQLQDEWREALANMPAVDAPAIEEIKVIHRIPIYEKPDLRPAYVLPADVPPGYVPVADIRCPKCKSAEFERDADPERGAMTTSDDAPQQDARPTEVELTLSTAAQGMRDDVKGIDNLPVGPLRAIKRAADALEALAEWVGEQR